MRTPRSKQESNKNRMMRQHVKDKDDYDDDDENNTNFAVVSLAAADSLAMPREFSIPAIPAVDSYVQSSVAMDSVMEPPELYDNNQSFDNSLAAADSLALQTDEYGYRNGAQGYGRPARKRKMLFLGVCACLLAAIVALSVVFTRKSDPSGGTKQSIDSIEENIEGNVQDDNIFLYGSEKLRELYYLLEPRVQNPAALLDIDTPEGMAFDVLVREMETKSAAAVRSINVNVQRYALLVLYFGTDGSAWTTTTGWSTPIEACGKWHGVVCQNSLVIGLDLDGNNLQGEIPEDFCLMSGLEFIRFSGNEVNLPTCLSKLSKLQEIDFRFNDYVGDLPTDLYELPSLVSLKLSDNRYVGSITKLFPKTRASGTVFPKLKILDLANNNLGGEIPDTALRRIPSLSTLILCGNPRLTGSVNEMCKGDDIGLIDVDYDIIECKCCSTGGSCPSSPLPV